MKVASSFRNPYEQHFDRVPQGQEEHMRHQVPAAQDGDDGIAGPSPFVEAASEDYPENGREDDNARASENSPEPYAHNAIAKDGTNRRRHRGK